ncbi:MAG: ribbon-helix-helix domain-containing protein [Armatimonadota bacterium]|jgi:hypothetical protein|nr:MAG: hypothetical protein KatS3mg024_2164 [Armatimonadota bacterium]
MVRTQIQLTEEQIHRAKALARRKGVSMAEVIRQALDAATRELERTDEVRRRATAIIGCVRSGLGDLSTNHDAYLTEDLGE